MPRFVASLILLLLALVHAQGKSIVRVEHTATTVHGDDQAREEGQTVEEEETDDEEDELMEEDDDGIENALNRFLLHQADASSPVDGVLLMANGKAFKSEEVERVCATLAGDVECLHDLPAPVVRVPSEKMAQLLTRLPVRYVSLQNQAPRAVKFLKEHMNEESAAQFLASYAEAGVKLPQEILLEFQDGLSMLSTDEVEDHDVPSPEDDGVAEEDPETGAKDFNHHYLLHQTEDEKTIDGVLYLIKGGAFTTAQLHMICDELSDDIKCLDKNVPMVVVRASQEHLDAALAKVRMVAYAPLKGEILPKVVSWMKGHLKFRQVKPMMRKYAKAGVTFPEKLIDEEFRRERVALDP